MTCLFSKQIALCASLLIIGICLLLLNILTVGELISISVSIVLTYIVIRLDAGMKKMRDKQHKLEICIRMTNVVKLLEKMASYVDIIFTSDTEVAEAYAQYLKKYIQLKRDIMQRDYNESVKYASSFLSSTDKQYIDIQKQIFNDIKWILYDYCDEILIESNMDKILTLNKEFLEFSPRFSENVALLEKSIRRLQI